MSRNDFATLAVIDAFRWWIHVDFGFLIETGILTHTGERTDNKVGHLDRPLLRRIAGAYSVSRNIPAHNADAEAEKLVTLFKEKAFRSALCAMDLGERGDLLAEFISASPAILVAAEEGGKPGSRQLASAISKLTWFMQPDGWTIFDKYVGVAALRKSGTGTAQFKSFYGKLAPSWDQTTAELKQVVVEHGFNELLSYRIIDKYLFCHGLGMFAVADGKSTLIRTADITYKIKSPALTNHRNGIIASQKALSPYLGTRLSALGEALETVLDDAGWTD